MSDSIATIVERYASGGQRMAKAVEGLDRAMLHKVPPADQPDLGQWTIHQIVIHLQDSELALADRIKRTLSMEQPALLAWPELAFMQHLHYDRQTIDDAVQLVTLVRRQLGRALAACDAGCFDRVGIHSERGKQTVRQIIEFSDFHLDHHLSFIDRKRNFFKK